MERSSEKESGAKAGAKISVEVTAESLAAYDARVSERAARMERLAKPIVGEPAPALPALARDGSYE